MDKKDRKWRTDMIQKTDAVFRTLAILKERFGIEEYGKPYPEGIDELHLKIRFNKEINTPLALFRQNFAEKAAEVKSTQEKLEGDLLVLEKHRKLYKEGSPAISNEEYDELKRDYDNLKKYLIKSFCTDDDSLESIAFEIKSFLFNPPTCKEDAKTGAIKSVINQLLSINQEDTKEELENKIKTLLKGIKR